jgi:hypothetical protein
MVNAVFYGISFLAYLLLKGLYVDAVVFVVFVLCYLMCSRVK